jgi:hypothetical protein
MDPAEASFWKRSATALGGRVRWSSGGNCAPLRVLVILAAIPCGGRPTVSREDAKTRRGEDREAIVRGAISCRWRPLWGRSAAGWEQNQARIGWAFCSPCRGWSYMGERNPRLTPWATLCRPSGPVAMTSNAGSVWSRPSTPGAPPTGGAPAICGSPVTVVDAAGTTIARTTAHE